MKQDARLKVILTAVLVTAVLTAYAGVRRCGFIYDDTIFITQNSYVQQGLSSQSLKWALTAYDTGNWHPLTWVSHFVDYSLFGMNPAGHHIVNLILHLLNAVLLFWILTRMTGSVWPSFFVAAFFAVHPLRVESVAWVSERKDVLAGTFWMLAIAAYSRYVERPGIGRYLLVAASFLLGLMCKPMMVTFPFVLFLLDYWPLERFHPARPTREAGRRSRGRSGPVPSLRLLIAEKIPLLVMAAAVIAVTLAAQRREGGLALMQTGALSLGIRLGNAVVSYASYLLKSIYPAGLAVFYPHPKQNLASGDVVLSLTFLVAFTALMIYAARRGARFALTGWLWYLGVLVPVIGIVQTGAYAMADRYTYLPSIGFLIVVVWGAAWVLEKRPRHKRAAGIAGLAVLVAMIVLTAHQVGYWRDGTTLYTHAIEVTKNNHVAYYNLARVELMEGKIDSAIRHLEETVRLVPGSIDARTNLGIALSAKGRHKEAAAQLEAALELDPKSAKVNNNYGQALAMAGRLDESAQYFEKAIELDPGFAKARYNLAYVRSTQGRYDEALKLCDAALRLQPGLTAAAQLKKSILDQLRATGSSR